MSCCICMERDREAVNIEEFKWNDLLMLVVPEVDWQSSWMVCTSCYTNLKKIEEFRELCLNSEIKRAAAKEAMQESPTEFRQELETTRVFDSASVEEAKKKISQILMENIFF